MTAMMIEISRESVESIRRHEGAGPRMIQGMSGGLAQGLTEIENNLIINYLSGSPKGGKQGGLPLSARSRNLRGSIASVMEEPLSGRVGSLSGTADAYAGVQLGNDTWVITPKSGKLLSIPVGKALDASGKPRYSGPREAAEAFGLDGAWIKGPSGTMVYFQPTGGAYQRGEKKGQAKGEVLFIGVPRVTVVGSGALQKSAEDRIALVEQLVLQGAITGWQGGDA